MANNLIQIKRSLSTATPTSLANGEMAYTANGDNLFIGSNGVVVAIGGKKNPGVLTANQALVANSTSGIDKVITANAVLQKVYANGTHGTTGFVLAVDSGGNTYWQDPNLLTTSAAGTNGQIQFNGGTNDLTASDGLVFTAASNTLFVGNTFTVGANVTLGTSSLLIGNSTVNTYITQSSVAANSLTIRDTTVSSNTTTGAATIAGGLGVAGRINTGDLAAGNTTVYSTLTGTTLATINVHATGTVNGTILSVGTAVVGNSTGVWTTGTVNGSIISQGSNFIANSTQVTSAVPAVLNANVTLGDSASDVLLVNAEVGSNVVPSANVTHNLGAINDRWNYVYAANVHSGQGYFEGNVQIVGDLVVSGNVTTVNVSSLEVTDPLTYLAGNNYVSDIVDIGFVGNYYDGATQRHAGFIRHAATDQFYLFKGYTAEPDNNVIDVGNTSLGYVQGTLNAFLDTGKGLVANSTAVTITANGAVAVNITANSITLSTPLAATDGGTSFDTYTSGDILVANTGNALSKLSLGSDGHVLQSNGTALVYSTLDGGTF